MPDITKKNAAAKVRRRGEAVNTNDPVGRKDGYRSKPAIAKASNTIKGAGNVFGSDSGDIRTRPYTRDTKVDKRNYKTIASNKPQTIAKVEPKQYETIAKVQPQKMQKIRKKPGTVNAPMSGRTKATRETR